MTEAPKDNAIQKLQLDGFLKWISVILAAGTILGGILVFLYFYQIQYLPKIDMDVVGTVVLLLPPGLLCALAIALVIYVFLLPGVMHWTAEKPGEEKFRSILLFGLWMNLLLGTFCWFLTFKVVTEIAWLSKGLWSIIPITFTSVAASSITIAVIHQTRTGKEFFAFKKEAKDRWAVARLFGKYSFSAFICGLFAILSIGRFGVAAIANLEVASSTAFVVAAFSLLVTTLVFFRDNFVLARIILAVICAIGVLTVIKVPETIVAHLALGNREAILFPREQGAQLLNRLNPLYNASNGYRVHILSNVGPRLFIEVTPIGALESRKIEIPRDEVDIEFLPVGAPQEGNKS